MSGFALAVSVVAAVLLVPLLHGALWFVMDGTEAQKLRFLFQPQWQREADFLARSIPAGDAWT